MDNLSVIIICKHCLIGSLMKCILLLSPKASFTFYHFITSSIEATDDSWLDMLLRDIHKTKQD